MNVKKIKRKCGVRGCKNIDNVFIISKTREMSNSLVLCTDCMKSAFAETEKYIEPKKVKKVNVPLFPHPELEVTISSVDKEPEPKEVIEDLKTEEFPLLAEDTVTIDEVMEEVETPKPKPKTSNNKKKTNKKK